MLLLINGGRLKDSLMVNAKVARNMELLYVVSIVKLTVYTSGGLLPLGLMVTMTCSRIGILTLSRRALTSGSVELWKVLALRTRLRNRLVLSWTTLRKLLVTCRVVLLW